MAFLAHNPISVAFFGICTVVKLWYSQNPQSSMAFKSLLKVIGSVLEPLNALFPMTRTRDGAL